jgi:hypothetical protein
MEVSGLLGRLPSRVGYQPTLAADLAALEERITASRRGDMVSLQAMYVPADDYSDPAITHAFWHLDHTEHFVQHRNDDGAAADAEKAGKNPDQDAGARDPEREQNDLADRISQHHDAPDDGRRDERSRRRDVR